MTYRSRIYLLGSGTVVLAGALSSFLWLNWSWAVATVGAALGYVATRALIEVQWWKKTPAQFLKLLPGVALALDYQRLRRENEVIAMTMWKTLEAHGIGELPEATAEHFGHKLDTEIAWSDRVQECAELTADALKAAGAPPVQAWILELLFYERDRGVPSHLWPPEPKRLAELSEALLEHSCRLAPWRESLRLEVTDLIAVLQRLKTFRLGEIEERLQRAEVLWTLENEFFTFLAENGLANRATPLRIDQTLKRMENLETGRDPRLSSTMIADLATGDRLKLLALLGLAEAAIGESGGPLSHEEIERRALLAVILFPTRTFQARAIRPAACHLLASSCGKPRSTASDPAARRNWPREGVRMAWAYLDVHRDFHAGLWGVGQPFVHLGEFFAVWPERAQKELAVADLKELYFALLEGEWLATWNTLAERVFARHMRPLTDSGKASGIGSVPEVEPAQPILPTPGRAPERLLPEFPEIVDPLRRLAAKIDLPIIERYIEHRGNTPYLITLGPSSGPLPRLLDCLTRPSKRKQLEDAGIPVTTADDNNIALYDFRQYTPYSRIGLVPRGMSFSSFAGAFREAVGKLIAHQTSILPITARDPVGGFYEILLHAFNPAASNPLGFGQPKLGGGAMQRVKELFTEQLDSQELLSCLIYAGMPGRPAGSHLLELLMGTSVAAPTRTWDDLSDTAKRELENKDGLIKDELFGKLDRAGRDAASTLASGPELSRVEDLLARVICDQVKELGGRAELCQKIASAYLEAVQRDAGGNLRTLLRRTRLANPLHAWDQLSAADRAALEAADEEIKRDFLDQLDIGSSADEQHLIHRIERSGKELEGVISMLAAAIERHAPALAAKPEAARRVAEGYLETLRATARDLVTLELALGRSMLIAA